MSVKDGSHDSSGVFFITFTCFRWLPLFEITNSYDLVYKWFDYLNANHHKIFAYVIMPNHIHLLLGKVNDNKLIAKLISNGKRFMAYGLVKRLTAIGRDDLLTILHSGVNCSDSKRGKIHQVFQPSFDCKACYSTEFIWQKINYIHNNPVCGKWQLAADSISYPHSSAAFYEDVSKGSTKVTYVGWLDDNILSTQ